MPTPGDVRAVARAHCQRQRCSQAEAPLLCYIGGVQAPQPLLTQEFLERLERLTLRWHKSFHGLLGGQITSRYAGVGHEFHDHRRFQYGDDLRAVNWRVYLRLERVFLKMFLTEPRTPIRLFLDTSESMAHGAEENVPENSKFAYACRLAAALCYVGLVRLETILIQPFAAELGKSFRAEGGRHRFAGAAAFLGDLSTSGPSDLRATVREFLSRNPVPGFAIFLSDFLDKPDGLEALRHMSDENHEVALVQLAGPQDRTPPWRGQIELIDAESGVRSPMHVTAQDVDRHAAAYDAFYGEVEYIAKRNRGSYLHLNTDTVLEEALFGPLVAAGVAS